MPRVAKLTAAIALGLVVVAFLGLYAIAELGQEVVVLHRYEPGGEPSRVRVWIVDEGKLSWVHHGEADAPWILRLADDPVVSLDRAGVTSTYRATPNPEAHALVHRLVGEKYGRIARAMAQSPEDCPIGPVRLESRGR